MPLSDQEIQAFTLKAQKLGADPQTIAKAIAKKQQATLQMDEAKAAAETGIISKKEAFAAGVPVAALGEVSDKAVLSDAEKTAKAKEEKALLALGNLETLFGRGDAANIGTDKDLAQRKRTGILGVPGNLMRDVSASLGLDGGKSNEEKQFKAAIGMSAAPFSQALGSGTPQEGELQLMIKNAPNRDSTDAEVKTWFNNLRSLLSNKSLADIRQEQSGQTPVGNTKVQNVLDDDDEALIMKYAGGR